MESSSPPWRVFDSPGGSGSDGSGQAEVGKPNGVTGLTGSDPRLAIAGLVGALAIGALAVVLAVSGAGGGTIDGPTAVAGGGAASGEPQGASGEVVVNVAGAVVAPGVYHLAAGSRVGDAIDAAGGFSPRVDVDRVGIELNLAAPVADGAQVRVPSRDDLAAATTASDGAGSGTGGGQTLNLNTATKAELEALPGIGPVTADKIIASREAEPFRAVEDLRARELLGEKTFEKIRALLTVG